jgi:hypothetical protein
MNHTTRTLTTLTALTLAGIALAPSAAATPNCTGRAALNTIDIALTDTTYTATYTPTPGCETADVTIAAHDTAHNWDPTETQPLIASHTAKAGAGRLEWALPQGVAPRCRLQLDLVTGPPLDVVDPTHRYNETAIGGTANRLIDARYNTDSKCTPTTTSTTPATTSSTTTTQPAVTTWRTTPLPEQPFVSIPPGGDVAIDPPPTTAPTPYTAVPRLPETGAAHTTALLSAGALSLLTGLLAVGLTPLRRAMNNHRKDSK